MLQIKPSLFAILKTEILSDFTVVIRCRYFYSEIILHSTQPHFCAFVTWKKVVIYFQLFFFSISVGLLLWNKTGQTEKWWIIQNVERRRHWKAEKDLFQTIQGISSFLSSSNLQFFPWKEAESYVLSFSRMTVTKVWLAEKKYCEDF